MRDGRRASLLLLATLLGALAGPTSAQAVPPLEAADPELLVTGLAGGSGSTVGPDGALYVPEPVSGEVSRIDPRTGATTVVASCLPPQVLVGDAGGTMDVAFLGSTMYALTSLVSEDVGGSAVTGVFRVEDEDTCEVVADIGAWTMENPPPPDFDFFVPSGVPYAMEAYQAGFLVTDGHANRVLQVTLDGRVRTVLQLGNVVPLGLDVVDRAVYLTLAGPVPHLPEDGQVLSLDVESADSELVASGGRLLVDVEAGREALYALAQGDFPEGATEGSPALPDTGQLLVADRDGGLDVVAAGLDRPTSMEVVDGNAYVVTYDGEVWRVEGLPGGRHR
ncbi:ScyD/ScyE family protein [Geodermatophilus sp. SYSU D01176]